MTFLHLILERASSQATVPPIPMPSTAPPRPTKKEFKSGSQNVVLDQSPPSKISFFQWYRVNSPVLSPVMVFSIPTWTTNISRKMDSSGIKVKTVNVIPKTSSMTFAGLERKVLTWFTRRSVATLYFPGMTRPPCNWNYFAERRIKLSADLILQIKVYRPGESRPISDKLLRKAEWR